MSIFSAARFMAASALLASVSLPSLAQAQSAQNSSGNGGWFVPKTAQPAPPPAQRQVRRVPVAQPMAQDSDEPMQQPETPPVLPQPPIPDSPDLPKAAPPPAALLGVISIPTVMRLSSAAAEAQRVLGERRDKLAAAAQKEQAGWRAEQQKLQESARTLTSEQIQLRERHLQERRANAQRDFANRARIIQEAANVSLNQIERELVRIVRQVAASHSMNLVLHSEQVALHVDGQDITEETAKVLNKVLPHVFIPAEDVDPEVLAKSGKMPTTADEDTTSQVGPGPAAQAAPAQPEAAPASILRKH
ncbi:OmpH family outer membrane protein [Asaia krungthepensis]|uniref:Outer membrane protein OmpH n=1 Tax=Asaia krungthepensis NRIC 0535 TaxID=1307925 RepID=A0ABQ0Q5W0_9PROT|nr:OmpH family outer membrane protein [Asaia krungthepensis]GBQ92886.1 outer membrane protein OmpH [Asaia krungthepensis NRIC 0535]